MPTVHVGDWPLFYFEQRVPTPSTPPLLLIHGAGGQYAHWPPQVRRLEGIHIIAPDLPGHGRSGGEGCDSISTYAAVMRALMDALGVERFIVGGHSMGGAIALQLALDAPQRVAGLVLVATGARLRVTPQILDRVLTDYEAVVDFVIAHSFAPSADEALRQVGRRILKATPPQVVYDDYLACNRFDVMERLAQIAAPALVIGGTADEMTPPKYLHYLAEHLPDAELHLLDGTGHMIMAERPVDVAGILRGWLERRFGCG